MNIEWLLNKKKEKFYPVTHSKAVLTGDNNETIEDALTESANQVNTLNSRIDTAISAVTTSTEVTDIRVGANGKTYSTAGTAVREQFNETNSSISGIQSILGKSPSVFLDTPVSISAGGQILLFDNGIVGHKYLICLSVSKPDGGIGFFEDGWVNPQSISNNICTITLQSSAVFMIAYRGNTYDGSVDVFDVTDDSELESFIMENGYKSKGKVYGGSIQPIIDYNQPSKIISAFGDSLTQLATPGEGYVARLEQLLTGQNFTIKNYGIGGEGSDEILARQGGYPAIVNPFTIPASGSAIITFKSTAIGRVIGSTISSDPLYGINPVTINGIQGTIDKDSNGNTIFTRSTSGSAVTIKRSTPVFPYSMLTTSSDLQIIWMGTNGGWYDLNGTSDVDVLVKQHKLMIDYMKKANKQYLIIGLHVLQTWIENSVTFADMEKKMQETFGRKYINIREYITTPIKSGSTITSCYGLDDLGLTATSEDLSAIAAGKVPPTLMYDTIHFNNYGYTIVGNLVYERGKELGYWN